MNDWVLLIDFGTSFSRAAIVDADGRVEPIEVDGGSAMPSGVWADSAGRLVAGLIGRRQARLAPERWDRAPKRSLGSPTLALGRSEVAAPSVVAQVFRQLSAEAIKRRGGPPREVRLTCSARLDAGRREALLAAARLAKLDVPAVSGGVRLVETPFAASRYLAEHGKLSTGATIALLDLGGGGVETSVIEAVGDRFVVRALGGIAGLGGEMFDDLLYQRVVIKGLAERDPALARRLLEPPDAEWRRAAEGLFREIRRAKEELSHSQNVPLDVGTLTDLPLRLSRYEVEAALRPEILRSARELAATIELAGLRPRNLDAVYLTGGSSRMPLVGRVIFDVLGVQPTARLDESSFLAGAAAWTPDDRIDLETTPITTAGRKREAEVPTQPLTEPGGIRLADIRAALIDARPTPTPPSAPTRPIPTRPSSSRPAPAPTAKPPAATRPPATRPPATRPPATPPPAGRPSDDHASRRRLALPTGRSQVATPSTPERPHPKHMTTTGGRGAGPERATPVGSESIDARPIWRRRWLLITIAAIVVVLGLLAFKISTSGGDVARAAGVGGSGTTQLPGRSVINAESALSTTVGAVTGLSARTQKTAIELRWQPVPGAVSYVVQRDAGLPTEVVRSAFRTSFGDRPGDGDLHRYTVAAVDQSGLSGPVATTVQGRATSPYGDRQNIASAWTGIVPPKPGVKGSAGQICHASASTSSISGDHSTGEIRCSFRNGVRLDILSYASATDRDLQAGELALGVGVQSTGWNAVPASGGSALTGRLLASGAAVGSEAVGSDMSMSPGSGAAPGSGPSVVSTPQGPWRWWTYDAAPTSAMYAVWPGHTAQALSSWWQQRAPFRR